MAYPWQRGEEGGGMTSLRPTASFSGCLNPTYQTAFLWSAQLQSRES